MTTAVGYCRISKRSEDGASLDAQERSIREAAEARGWGLDHVEREVASAAARKRRPGLESAIVRAAATRGTLVVARLDRLSRSTLHFAGTVERARREGWNLVVLDLSLDLATPHGAFTASVLAAAAQLERDLIGARTTAGLAEKRRRGVRIGRPRTLDPKIATRIRKMHAHGRSLYSIAEQANAEGWPTASGRGSWYPSTVRAIVNRD